MPVAKERASRTKRLNIRATENQEKLIRRGAERKGLNVSSFILKSACLEAEHALADQNHFVLSPEKWEKFVQMLDRPARVHPRLAKLLLEPSVLEK